MPLHRIFSRPLSNVLFQGLGFGSSGGSGPAPEPILDAVTWFDEAITWHGEPITWW